MVRVDFDAEQEEAVATPNVSTSSARLVGHFSGTDPLMEVDDWLGLFELVTVRMTDQDRIIALGRHLDGDAFRWMVREIAPTATTIPWADVRTKMITRFRKTVDSFMNDAIDRELKTGESLHAFVNEKRRLMTLADLNEANQVAMLTRGIPNRLMRTQIAAARPKSTEEWLQVATAIEASLNLNNQKDDRKPAQRRQRDPDQIAHHVDDASAGQARQKDRQSNQRHDSTRPPPGPCPVCKAIFNTREMHWKRDCPQVRQAQASRGRQRDPSGSGTARAQPSGAPSTATSTTTEATNFVNTSCFVWVDTQVNGKHIRGLLDSGSSLTAISHAVAKRLKLKWDTRMSIPLKHIVGDTRSVGAIEADVTIQGKTLKNRVHVIDNLGPDMLVGVDLINKAKLSIAFDADPARRSIAIHHLQAEENVSFFLMHHTDHAVEPMATQVNALINRFPQVFSQGPTDFGQIKGAEHTIRLKPGSEPFSHKPYRLSPPRQAAMRQLIQELLAAGIIEPSCSPFACAAFPVPRKGGKGYRLVCDSRDLNKMTIAEHTPLPHIGDVLDKLSGSSLFTTLDIAFSFFQVPLHPSSHEKTAFVTPDGQFQFKFLVMGLKNATSVFQRTLRHVLRDSIGNGVESFIDDLIIHTKTPEEHLALLERVFQRLSDFNIKLRREKCTFMQTEVEFLGHRISAGQVRPSMEKIKAITEFPMPKCVRDVQEVLGIANFFRSFVPNFSDLVKPLTDLLRKDVPFEWPEGGAADMALRKLKEVFASIPMRHIFDPSLPCELWTDASLIGLGAVLFQIDPNNQKKIVAFWSKKLTEPETRYSATERECLAVVKAIEHFECYLDGQQFTVITDCQALAWLMNLKKANARLHRWSIRLSPFDFKIRHRPGTANVIADFCSRHPIGFLFDDRDLQDFQDEIKVYGLKKPLLKNGLVHVKLNGILQPVVPPSLVPRLLRNLHDDHNHQGAAKMIQLIAGRFWFPNRDATIQKFVKSCHTCQVSKQPNESLLRPTHPIETPDNPNELWSADAVVLGSSAANTAAKCILVVIDNHSRFVWAKAVKRLTKEATVDFFAQLFDDVSPPKALLSDNGTNFVSNAVKNLLQKHGVRHMLIPPHRSQANGVVERAQGTIVTALRCALVDNPKLKWSSLLRDVVNNLNDSIHKSTGFAPRFLHFGQTKGPVPSVSVEEARKRAAAKSQQQQTDRKVKNDLRAKPQHFQIGDLVRYRIPDNDPLRGGKLSPRWLAPCKVTEALGQESFRIEQLDPQTRQLIRSFISHAGRLAPYNDRDQTDHDSPEESTEEEATTQAMTRLFSGLEINDDPKGANGSYIKYVAEINKSPINDVQGGEGVENCLTPTSLMSFHLNQNKRLTQTCAPTKPPTPKTWPTFVGDWTPVSPPKRPMKNGCVSDGWTAPKSGATTPVNAGLGPNKRLTLSGSPPKRNGWPSSGSGFAPLVTIAAREPL